MREMAIGIILVAWSIAANAQVVDDLPKVEARNGSGQRELSAEDLFQKVSASVYIVIARSDRNEPRKIIQGSAVAVTPNLLLTNCHVVTDNESIRIIKGSTQITVSLTFKERSSDRCVLRSATRLDSFVPIRRYDSVRIGETVYAIGAPKGIFLGADLSITQGLVSAKRTSNTSRYIQTNAPISEGSSGGGLFDKYGNLVGITTFTLKESQNLNFAIAAEDFFSTFSKEIGPHRREEPTSKCEVQNPTSTPPRAPSASPPLTEQRAVRVQRGEYFRDLLMRSGVNGADATLAQISLSGVYDVRKMRAGQLVILHFGTVDGEQGRFIGLAFDSNYDRTVWIQRQSRGDYVATEMKKELTLQVLRNNGVIDHSVFQAGLQSGMPPEPIVRMINLFAYDVDFQGAVLKGGTFETLIEQHRDRNGDIVRYGNILYAALTIQGNTIKLYRWQGDDGEADYFTEKGDSSRKALMRTPIDGASVLLGYSKIHPGIDFAAPVGTPIYAAGDGQIERLGWHGGYGNAIVIRHTKDYSTLYGHMSGFAPGMQPGKRVKQGDIIGFVGTTGISTGPHLHYEVHLAGKQIDPLSLKLPSRQRLHGAEFVHFQQRVHLINACFRKLGKNGAIGSGLSQVE